MQAVSVRNIHKDYRTPSATVDARTLLVPLVTARELMEAAGFSGLGATVHDTDGVVLGITNTMSMAVLERVPEVGVLRALGFSSVRLLALPDLTS